jgi:hypothetical protein
LKSPAELVEVSDYTRLLEECDVSAPFDRLKELKTGLVIPGNLASTGV